MTQDCYHHNHRSLIPFLWVCILSSTFYFGRVWQHTMNSTALWTCIFIALWNPQSNSFMWFLISKTLWICGSKRQTRGLTPQNVQVICLSYWTRDMHTHPYRYMWSHISLPNTPLKWWVRLFRQWRETSKMSQKNYSVVTMFALSIQIGTHGLMGLDLNLFVLKFDDYTLTASF